MDSTKYACTQIKVHFPHENLKFLHTLFQVRATAHGSSFLEGTDMGHVTDLSAA